MAVTKLPIKISGFFPTMTNKFVSWWDFSNSDIPWPIRCCCRETHCLFCTFSVHSREFSKLTTRFLLFFVDSICRQQSSPKHPDAKVPRQKEQLTMQARDNPSGGVPPAHQTWIRQQTLHMCWFSAAAATAADKLLTAPSEEEVLGRFTEEELKRYKKRKWHHDVGKHTRKYKEREERRKNSLGKRNKSQREKSTAVATRRVAEVSNPGSVVTEVVCRVPAMKMSKKILYDKNGQRRLSVVPVGEQLLEFLRRVDQYAPKNSKLAQWRTVSKTNGRLFHRRPDENCQGMRWMRDLCKRVKGVPSGYFRRKHAGWQRRA